MAFLENFIKVMSLLTFVDFIFFVSMMLLIILVVVLIYFIKINKDNSVEEIIDLKTIEESISNDVNDEDDAIIDLAQITKALEDRKTSPIEMTEYELEQEERAIISYDELIERSKNLSLNYEMDEESSGEINIKKVNLENLVNQVEKEKPSIEVRVISYQKEEAFLEALKNLKEQIN